MSAEAKSEHVQGLRNPPQEVVLRISRRDRQDAPPRWEEFRTPLPPESQHHLLPDGDPEKPRHARRQEDHAARLGHELSGTGLRHLHDGHQRPRAPVVLGAHRQLEPHKPITLEPMSKFPNVRDLVVDRSEMFDHLKRVKAWIEIDGTYDLGAGPRMSQEDVAERYAYSRCMTCGCCLEACPQYGDGNYIGPQAIAQVRLMNMHPTGKMTRDDRLYGHHRRRRHHQLRQRAELRPRLPDVAPADQSHLRGEPRDRHPRPLRLAPEVAGAKQQQPEGGRVTSDRPPSLYRKAVIVLHNPV